MSDIMNSNKHNNNSTENLDEIAEEQNICADTLSDKFGQPDGVAFDVDDILDEILNDNIDYTEESELIDDKICKHNDDMDDLIKQNHEDVFDNNSQESAFDTKDFDDDISVVSENSDNEYDKIDNSLVENVDCNEILDTKGTQLSFYDTQNGFDTNNTDKPATKEKDKLLTEKNDKYIEPKDIEPKDIAPKSKVITLNLKKIRGKIEKQILKENVSNKRRSFKYRLYKVSNIFREQNSCDVVSIVGTGFLESVAYELQHSVADTNLDERNIKLPSDECVFNEKCSSVKKKFKKSNFIKKISPLNKEESIFNFKNRSDIPQIRKLLFQNMRRNFFSNLTCAACTLVLFIISIYFRIKSEVLSNNSIVYVLLSMVILFVSCLSRKNSLKKGIKGLFHVKQFDLETSLLLAIIITFLQNIIAIINLQHFVQNGSVIFDLLVVVALFLDSAKEFFKSRRIYSNFKFLSTKQKLSSLHIYHNEKQAQKMFDGFGNYQAKVVYQKELNDPYDYLKTSSVPTLIDILCKKLAFPAAFVCIAITIIYGFVTKDLLASFTVFSLFSCVSFSMSGVLAANWLIFNLSNRANQMGGMISGYSAVEHFGDTNAVVIDSNTLYPKECVYLHKIKGLSSVSVDRVVLDVAAILIKAKSPLAPIFDSVIKGKKDMLPYVDSVSYNDNLGIEAWIQGRKVLLGNRFFMEDNCVYVGHKNDELKYTKDGKQVTYVAFSNELVCMLVTSYRPSNKMIRQMQNLEDSGVNFLITTTDPNIVPKTIANHFRIFFRSVKILPTNLAESFNNDLMTSHNNEYNTSLVTNGTLLSFAGVLSSSIRLKSSIIATAVVYIVCVILCFSTAIFLVCHTGIVNLHLLEMLFYSLFWAGAVLLVSKLRR